MLTNQIYTLTNDAFNDAVGKNAGVTTATTTSLVDMGKTLSNYDLYDAWFGALVNRIAATYYMVRNYERKNRRILRDETAYGAFKQLVYFKMPDNVEAKEYAIPQSSGGTTTYTQSSPFDVSTTVEVAAKIFGGRGTWAIEVIKPLSQIKSAFLNEADMLAFISGIDTVVINKMEKDMEVLEALAASTGIAASIQGGKVLHAVTAYNALNNASVPTGEAAGADPDFMKYVSKFVSQTVNRFGNMSTYYNVEGWENFTNREDVVVEVLSEVAASMDVYLSADTFHNELVALPNYNKVDYWQSIGDNGYAWADTSKIDIINEGLVTSSNTDGQVTASNVAIVIRDIDNVAAFFGDRRTWETYNPRSNVMIHGETAVKGYGVNGFENSFVICFD